MAEIKVLIVDDSATTAVNLKFIIEKDPDMKVCAIAANGRQAMRYVKRYNPHVIVMDVYMPEMDGYEATKAILYETAVPIVICSATWEPGEVAKTFHAVEVGAVTAIPKPPGVGHRDFKKHARDFRLTVKSMSEVKVVRRRNFSKIHSSVPEPQELTEKPGRIEIICIGASTGGPIVLKDILKNIPENYPIPIVVIQHIACGFMDGLVMWLQQTCRLHLKIAEDRETLKPGRVYFPPDAHHLGIRPEFFIRLDSEAPEEHNLKPSIGYTFRSLARHYGSRAAGIMLTGMGSDGAPEMKEMADKGAITIAQEEKSCAVFGMPQAAIELGGVTRVMSPEEISSFMLQAINKKPIIKSTDK